MTIGELLVYGSSFALLASLAFSILGWRKPEQAARTRPLAQRSLWLAWVFFLLAMLILIEAFLTSRFNYQYVWSYTHSSYPWWQKLAGLWAGREGSLMVWMHWMLLFLAIAELISWRKESRHRAAGVAYEEPPSRAAARVVALLALVAFFAIFLPMDVFAPADPANNPPEGKGLNPQLVTVLMAIHPPLLFSGYALTVIPFAAATGHFLTGDRRWTEFSRPWTYAAFFALTLAVGLGGVWAYIALGWGGYWAWDPVEMASTVPWVLVAMLLHAQMRHVQNREFSIAAPLVAYLSFFGSLFATFVTRAGGLWVSVHSFLGSRYSPDPIERLKIALFDQAENLGYFLVLVGGLAVGMVLLYFHTRRLEEAAPAMRDGGVPLPRTWFEKATDSLRMPALFSAAVMLFALALVVILTLLIVAINGFQSSDARIRIYETRVGPVVLGMMTVLGFALSSLLTRRTYALAITLGALALSLAGALVFDEQRELAGAIPVLTLVAVTAAWLVLRNIRRGRLGALRTASIHTIHLGAALLLLGYGFSSTVDESFPVLELAEGQSRSYKDVTLTLERIETEDTNGDGRTDVVTPHLYVKKGADALGREAPSFEHFYWFGPGGFYRPDVAILSVWSTDVYLTPRGFYDSDQGWIYSNLPLFDQGKTPISGDVTAVAMEVSLLPFVRLLWIGWGLMLLGIALRMVVYVREANLAERRLVPATAEVA